MTSPGGPPGKSDSTDQLMHASRDRLAAWCNRVPPSLVAVMPQLRHPAETAGHIATWIRQNLADIGTESGTAN